VLISFSPIDMALELATESISNVPKLSSTNCSNFTKNKKFNKE